MGFEGQLPEGLEGVSPAFIEALYARYADDAGSVDPSWRQFFEGLDQARSGPSWARPNWQLPSTNGPTAAMGPTQMALETRELKRGEQGKHGVVRLELGGPRDLK